MKARKSDLVAMGFLIAAVVAFVLYQVLVEYRFAYSVNEPGLIWEEVRGFEVWMMVYEAQIAGYLDHFFRFMIGGLVIGVVVTLVSPFLVGVLVRSRPLWWLVVSCSGLAVVGMVGGSAWQWISDWGVSNDELEYAFGFYCSLAFPILNFIGLLFVRRRVATLEVAPLQGES